MEKCKRCGSSIFYLEPRVKGESITEAAMVAQRCTNCNFFKRWCPKDERHLYIGNKRAGTSDKQAGAKENKQATQEGIKNVLMALFSHVKDINHYELYTKYTKESKEIMAHFFTSLMRYKEGMACSVDKGHYIANALMRAFETKQNIMLAETYNQYKARGGNLGGINETNTDMDEITYWSPTTIKDTDQAFDLFHATITLNYEVIKNFLEQKVSD